MSQESVVFFDRDRIYCKRLSDYLVKKRGLKNPIVYYDKKENVLGFLKNNKAKIILVNESLYEKELHLYCEKIILLTEKDSYRNESFSKLKTIKKNQSAEQISNQIFEILYYKENKKEADTKNLSLIGVYSPLKRCFQTTFSIQLGQILSKKAHVLYLNLEPYSGFQNSINTKNLSDLLYFLKYDKENVIFQLFNMIHSIQGLDYILPVSQYLDFQSISIDDWNDLIDLLRKNEYYNYIILDLSEEIQGLFELLLQCDRIYTLHGNDDIANTKIFHYESILKAYSYHQILEKSKKVTIPVFHDFPSRLEELPHKELSDYIKNNFLKGNIV